MVVVEIGMLGSVDIAQTPTAIYEEWLGSLPVSGHSGDGTGVSGTSKPSLLIKAWLDEWVPTPTNTVIGANNGGNCYPFSCFASETFPAPGVTYQEVYNAGAFAGAITVDSISFRLQTAGPMDSASYQVAFYLTNRPVMGLDTTLSNNLGALLSNFGAFNISGPMPPSLTLDGANFTYDPSLGNLLMQVTVTGLTEPHRYQSFFAADYTAIDVSRIYRKADGSTDGNVFGALQTRFNRLAVPEPTTWAMMLGGLAAIGAALRRRRPTLAT